MIFFPRNIDFFKLFDSQADELKNAIKIINLIKKDNNLSKNSKSFKKIEHRADEITHEIFKQLNQTFITPIDREDITFLANRLDDIFDEMDRAINRMFIYKINPANSIISKYCVFIEKSIEEVIKAVKHLKDKKAIPSLFQCFEKINYLENKTDDLNRTALSKLFETEKDPIMVIKLKEIYETLESVTDRCEDVANALETIVIKNI